MSLREAVVMWWSGMQGVASVALALAIPLKTDDGSAFHAALVHLRRVRRDHSTAAAAGA